MPWALYPLDLGHNFVLAHRECNSAKRDLLAAEEHSAAWGERNRVYGDTLGREFDRLGVMHSLPSTARITRWAYGVVFAGGGLTSSWARKQQQFSTRLSRDSRWMFL